MERSRYDAIRGDGEERRMLWMQGVLVCRSALARGLCEAVVRNDADGARVSGGGRHEAENSIDEGPISVEESSACVDEVLQHGKDVRKGS